MNMRFKNMLEYYNSKCVKHAHHIKTENSMRISVVDICEKFEILFTVGFKNGFKRLVLLYIYFFHLILKYR